MLPEQPLGGKEAAHVRRERTGRSCTRSGLSRTRTASRATCERWRRVRAIDTAFALPTARREHASTHPLTCAGSSSLVVGGQFGEEPDLFQLVFFIEDPRGLVVTWCTPLTPFDTLFPSLFVSPLPLLGPFFPILGVLFPQSPELNEWRQFCPPQARP